MIADLETLPMPGARKAAPHVCIKLLPPRVPTIKVSGRYNAVIRSMVSVTFPATNSTTTESYSRARSVIETILGEYRPNPPYVLHTLNCFPKSSA